MKSRCDTMPEPGYSFDVAITTFRRPELVKACVASCLGQGPKLRKIIVVDDASQDNTEEEVRSFKESRILYFQRATNGGISAARRDAFSLSDAEWTVKLDSDHELLPGAIERFAALAASTCGQADILGARYAWDTGIVTPQVVPGRMIGYRERIEYSSRSDSIGADYLCAVSKRVRGLVQPEPLRSSFPDTLFQLDIARQGSAVFTPECLALEKSCDEDSWTRGSAEKRWARRCQDSADAVRALELILQRHEGALKRWGVPGLASFYCQGAFYALLSGQRLKAWECLGKYLALRGLSRDCIGVGALLLAPRSVAKQVYLLRG